MDKDRSASTFKQQVAHNFDSSQHLLRSGGCSIDKLQVTHLSVRKPYLNDFVNDIVEFTQSLIRKCDPIGPSHLSMLKAVMVSEVARRKSDVAIACNALWTKWLN